MRIVVHIDQLVLDGFPAGANTRRISAAVERELSQLLSVAPSDPWRSSVLENVAAPPDRFAAADSPRAVGRGIARAVGFGIATTQAREVQPVFLGTSGEQP
jgi:hypothetical protein